MRGPALLVVVVLWLWFVFELFDRGLIPVWLSDGYELQAEFVSPDGMCKYCFRPRGECEHREFFIST